MPPTLRATPRCTHSSRPETLPALSGRSSPLSPGPAAPSNNSLPACSLPQPTCSADTSAKGPPATRTSRPHSSPFVGTVTAQTAALHPRPDQESSAKTTAQRTLQLHLALCQPQLRALPRLVRRILQHSVQLVEFHPRIAPLVRVEIGRAHV